MPTGTVATWNAKGGYGFATTGDGKTVFIHSSEFKDADDSLRGEAWIVGAKVTFTIESVAGHDGRVKGKNISGPGVVTWDAWKENYESGAFKDESMAAKEAWKEHKQGWPHIGTYEAAAG
eukprot:gene20152-7660_t